jgi:hypothetical protein
MADGHADMDIGFLTVLMVLSIVLVEIVVLMSSLLASRQRRFAATPASFSRACGERDIRCQPKSRRKPDWVVTEIIHLAALMRVINTWQD